MPIAGILRRWVLVSAVTGVLALIQVPGVRAQAVQPVQMPPSPNPSQPVQMPPSPNPNQPVPMAPSPGPLNSPAYGDTGAPGMAPGTPPAAPAGYSSGLSTLEVIRASLFDDIYSKEAQARWTPLPLGTFFTEGWDQPFVLPTSGNGGLAGTGESPRFGWINQFGGINYRAWFFELFYANNVLGPHYRSNGNQYIQDFTIFVPFNRRFEIQFDYLLIVSNKGGSNNTYHGNTGDTTISPRFRLSESKNFGQLFQMHVRTPTGARDNGNGVASLAPEYSFWWNAYGNWVMRGATGVTVPTNHAGARTSYNNFLGIGRYFKGSDDAWFHNSQLYLLAEEDSTIAGSARRESFFSLLPGFLTQVGKKLWFAYGAIEVPMVGPKAYTYQAIFAIVHAY